MRLTRDKARRAMGGFGHKRLTSASIIRVVKIKPNTVDGHIRVKLKVVDCRTTKYTALSYAYEATSDESQPLSGSSSKYTGSTTETGRTILCDGTLMQISQSLWEILDQLRRLNSDVPVWIDRLCINFNSREERAAQVNMMSYIYANASHVVVWLGLKEKATDDTILCMRKLVNGVDWRKLPRQFAADFRDPATYTMLKMDRISIQQWNNIYNFCHARWFSRLWAFYELASARQAMFLIGNCYMDYEFLMDFAMVLGLTGWLEALSQMATDGYDEESVGLTKMLGPVATLRSIPNWHPHHVNHAAWMKTEYGLNTEEERAWKFFELLLQSCERFECYDQHDRIFAPLAYVKKVFASRPFNKSWPIVDYDTSVEKVYSHFANMIRKHTHKPSILETAGHIMGQETPPERMMARGRTDRRIPLD